MLILFEFFVILKKNRTLTQKTDSSNCVRVFKLDENFFFFKILLIEKKTIFYAAYLHYNL